MTAGAVRRQAYEGTMVASCMPGCEAAMTNIATAAASVAGG